jgi:hypothetical protein
MVQMWGSGPLCSLVRTMQLQVLCRSGQRKYIYFRRIDLRRAQDEIPEAKAERCTSSNIASEKDGIRAGVAFQEAVK